jgi:hypothetical protein
MANGLRQSITLAAALILGAVRVRGAEATTTNSNAGPGPSLVLDYLRSITGKRVVAGIHNREPNLRPAQQAERMHKLVGRYPGLWSGDFLFRTEDVKNRWPMIQECRREWEQGAIVHLMLHVAPPSQPEVCP